MRRSRSRALAFVVATMLVSSSTSPGVGAQTAAATTAAGSALIVDGFARLDQGRLDEAKALFDKALAMARDERSPRLEAHAYRGLGRYWGQKNDPSAASEALDRSQQLFESLGDHAGLGQVWNQRATNAFFRQQWPDAEAGYRQALTAFERAGLPGEEANVLRNLTFLPTLRTEERLQLIATAVDRAVAARQPVTQALALHNWGDLLVQTGDYARAMQKLEEASAILEGSGPSASLARVYTSLGRTYRLHGEPALALPYYERALEWQRTSRDAAGEIQTLNAMAVANHVLQRTSAARALYDRALALALERGTPAQVSFVRRQFGIFLTDVGQPAMGASLLEQETGPQVSDADRVPALSTLSRAYIALKRYREAESVAGEAVRVASGSSNLDSQRSAHFSRAAAIRAAGRPADAVDDTRQMLQLVERMRPTLAQADALRLGFGERMRSYFDFAVSLLTEVGRPEEAFVATEQGRARAFLDLLASPRQPNAPAPSLDTLKRIASRLQSTVISYWVTPRETFVFLIDRDGAVHSHTIAVAASLLETRVAATAIGFSSAAGRLITRGPGDTGAPAQEISQDRLVLDKRAAAVWRELYDLLILPVRAWIPPGDSHLLTIVPDAALGRLSFAALRNERGRYLLEGYRIHYVSALSVLDLTAVASSERPATERVLVVANPALTAGSKSTASLAALPGARREAAAIARRSTGSTVDVLAGREATEARVRTEAAGRAVLHFAAHSVVRDDRPMDSFLALAGGEGVPGDDGVLTAREIYDLHLTASLVVLSACRSGGGKVTGDGIVGLTRAFMSAGVGSVVASVWDLPDETAPWLFERFYTARIRMPADAALRLAQLELLRALRTGSFRIETAAGTFVVPEHPAVWAGLQLWGQP